MRTLLSSSEVRDDYPRRNKRFQPDFNYSTAILRVNKHINKVASSVFEDNNFILVSTPGDLVKNEVIQRGLWHRDASNIKIFKRYRLRVHIIAVRFEKGQDRKISDTVKNWFLLIPNAALHDFICVLAALEYSRAAHFKLKIDFYTSNNQEMMASWKQQMMLQRFCLLQETERCSIGGDIDQKIASSFVKRMTSRVHWTRARCWIFYDLAYKTKDIADFKWASGDIKEAHDAYQRFFDWWSYAITVREDISSTVDDTNLVQSWWALMGFAAMHQLSTGLLLALEETDNAKRKRLLAALADQCIHRDMVHGAYFHAQEYSINQYLHGLIFYTVGKDADARQMLTAAYEAHPQPDFKTALDAWRPEAAPLARHAKIKSLLSFLPSLLQPMRFYRAHMHTTPIHSLDMELYILRELGYSGPCLHDRLEQTENHCIEPAQFEGVQTVPRTFDKALADNLVEYNRARLEKHEKLAGRKMHMRLNPFEFEETPKFRLPGMLVLDSHDHLIMDMYPDRAERDGDKGQAAAGQMSDVTMAATAQMTEHFRRSGRSWIR